MSQASSAAGAVIAMLTVYFILFSLIAGFIFVLARRKGQSRWFALFGYVPLVNMFCVLWMASLTDQRVLARLEALEKLQRETK